MHLTVEEEKSLQQGKVVPVTVAGTDCVLLRKDVFEHMKQTLVYEDSELTVEEMRSLAAQTFEAADQAGPIS